MRLKGIIIDAKYKKGISQNTGNAYEVTNYTMQITDEQGHNHQLVFSLMGDKMYQEQVHKGDMVEVSIQLATREYNGNKFNDVKAVYYVGKVNTQTVAQPQPQMQAAPQPQVQAVPQPRPAVQAPTVAPQPVQPSAPVFQQNETETNDLPF